MGDWNQKEYRRYNKKPFVWMAFCDALRLHGFGPCETKINNIIYNIYYSSL